jgi:EmrB/QacA subfamily drug resistance transporter
VASGEISSKERAVPTAKVPAAAGRSSDPSVLADAAQAQHPGPAPLVLLSLMLVAFIATLDQTIVATAIPGIGRSLHNITSAPWIATAYLLTSAVSTLILGKAGDTHGRKRVFQLAVVIFLAGSALSGLATSMGVLIAARAVQGIGGGGLTPLVQAITGDLIPARQRARYQAYIGMIATVAVVGGPVLGGLFVDDLSWRWIFFVNIPVGLTALAIIGAQLHLAVRHSARRSDIAGGLTITLFTTAALLVTVWGGTRFSWTSAQLLGLIAVALLTLTGFLLIERRAADPITPPAIFRSPAFAICAALFFLATLVLFAGLIYIPELMQYVRHYSSFEAGLFLTPLLVGLIGAAGLSGSVISRTGRYKIFPVAGAVLSGAGMLAVSRLGAASPAWVLAVLLAVTGIGLGFFVQVSVLAGQNAVDHAQLGVATGALNFFKTMGGAFGAALSGAILAARLAGHPASTASYLHGFQAVFFWTVPFMLVAMILSIALPERPLSTEIRDVAAGRADAPEY